MILTPAVLATIQNEKYEKNSEHRYSTQDYFDFLKLHELIDEKSETINLGYTKVSKCLPQNTVLLAHSISNDPKYINELNNKIDLNIDIITIINKSNNVKRQYWFMDYCSIEELIAQKVAKKYEYIKVQQYFFEKKPFLFGIIGTLIGCGLTAGYYHTRSTTNQNNSR